MFCGYDWWLCCVGFDFFEDLELFVGFGVVVVDGVVWVDDDFVIFGWDGGCCLWDVCCMIGFL